LPQRSISHLGVDNFHSQLPCPRGFLAPPPPPPPNSLTARTGSTFSLGIAVEYHVSHPLPPRSESKESLELYLLTSTKPFLGPHYSILTPLLYVPLTALSPLITDAHFCLSTAFSRLLPATVSFSQPRQYFLLYVYTAYIYIFFCGAATQCGPWPPHS
jgi:hypothetical protein